MSDPYRDAVTFDLDRERAVHAQRGAAIAIASIASWPIADLVVAIITSSLVRSGTQLPGLWTRVALVVAGRLVAALLAIAFIRVACARPKLPRSSDSAWLGLVILGAASVGSTYASTEVTRSMILRMPMDKLTEWVKDIDTISRVETLAGPLALLVILAYCLRRWEVAASRSTASCPRCHEPL
jgi:hypothetical protein